MRFFKSNISLWLQVVVVITLFLLPLTNDRPGQPFTLYSYLLRASQPFFLMLLFYINYLWLVPLMLSGNKSLFFTVNIVLAVCFSIGVNDCIGHVWHIEESLPHPHTWTPNLKFIFREIFLMAVSVGIATAVTMSLRWVKDQNALNEAREAQYEAELKNLQWQINPHFLLNTLNNIYALTEQDKKKSQTTILRLSEMLSYILYDNKLKEVPLVDETNFIHNYIELMRLRTTDRVSITETYDIDQKVSLQVVPMLFISLVENAFKHGISPTEDSFIDVYISGNAQSIVCQIRNSCYPKSISDHSGHGIGLENVARRLQLLYPERHTWEKGTITENNNSIYYSKISIYDS